MKFQSIKISEKIHIALRWLSYLAQDKTKKSLSLGEFAIKEKISFYYLQQISRKLKQSGLIKAREGSSGGYQLAKTAQKISLKEIVEAIEGPISLIDCINNNCCAQANCSSKRLWFNLNKKISNIFNQIKLSEIL